MAVTLQTGEALDPALRLRKAGAAEEAELLCLRVIESGPGSLDAVHSLSSAVLRAEGCAPVKGRVAAARRTDAARKPWPAAREA